MSAARGWTSCVALLLYGGGALAQHVPPDPPQRELGEHSYEEMAEMMQMDDRELYGRVTLDQLEWQETDAADVFAYETEAFYGGDYHKASLRSEGSHADGRTDARIEALWDRVIAPWWSMHAGARVDVGDAPTRTWLALGVEGLAPQKFEVEAALYVGDAGRTALRFDIHYDVLLTQRLVLHPQFETDIYGKDDPEHGIGSGLSDIELSLRLRYEIRREIAPYVGVRWLRRFGETADLARSAGADSSEAHFVAGLRVWF
ncbi:MAG: copper resistance protein B [Steroidobacteraceae bacterium]